MELDEILLRKRHLQQLESWENHPESPQKAYLTMERDEMIRYIEFLQERIDEEKRSREVSDKRFEEESAARKEADKRVFDLLDKIDRMGEQHRDELKKLQDTIENLTSTIRLSRKNRFSTTSQKSRHSSKKDKTPTRDEERDNHDGTPTSASTEAAVKVEETTKAAPVREDRDYRKGMKYKTMKVSRVILHKSDRSQLPAGAVVIRSYTKRYSYDEIVEFLEHDVEILVYKTADGKVVTSYLPYKEDNAYKGESSQFPGTHVTSSLLSYIAFNKYQMSIPLYREITRFLNHDMHISDGTLSNWFLKGSNHLKELRPYRQDGLYTIDNKIAERNIRPTTLERKNSLFYGSGMMAEVSAVYHTFISTCSMLGVSAQKYFKMFFSAIIEGRTDYANLLPMTIGIR